MNLRALYNNKKVLVTGGGTREMIDRVRYIGNRSSGKMGCALARVLKQVGAHVTLILGTATVHPPQGVHCIRVTSADEMAEAVKREYPAMQMIFMAAAVADWTPETPVMNKISKGTRKKWSLKLIRTTDILAELGMQKGNRILVGFAAESENMIINAAYKLKAKHLDIIAANNISIPGQGFGSDENAAELIDSTGRTESIRRMKKTIFARKLLNFTAQYIVRTNRIDA